MDCLVVCMRVCRGNFSVGGCQGLPIQRVAVPTHEGMCGKKCVTHEGRSVFSFLSECWSYQDSPQNFTILGRIPVGKSQSQNKNITFSSAVNFPPKPTAPSAFLNTLPLCKVLVENSQTKCVSCMYQCV